MSVARGMGCALLVGLTSLTMALPSAALPPASATSSLSTVTAPASTAVQAASAHGFYWQLTHPQPVVAGSILLEEHHRSSREKKRAGRSDEQLFEISTTGSNDVPEAALRAYHRAADTLASTDPSCHLPWTLLAGIGRVESNHGRFGGAQLGSDGVSRPAIVGPRLDGAGPFAAIRDTDHGALDGDRTWDRAVGQMQFLPSTWHSVGRDGDGDGKADPFDIDDSALAAGVYLCGAGDVSTTAGMARAAYRYNQSDYYVALVLAYAKGYETGVFALPSPPPEPGAGDGHPTRRTAEPSTHRTHHAPKHARSAHRAAAHPTAAPNSGATPRVRPSATPSPKPTPRPTTRPTTGPTRTPTRPTAPAPSPSPSPSAPQAKTLQGTWQTCATGYCLAGYTVDPGELATQAPADFDGDGTVETRGAELAGLAGRAVTVVLLMSGTTTGALQSIGGVPWR